MYIPFLRLIENLKYVVLRFKWIYIPTRIKFMRFFLFLFLIKLVVGQSETQKINRFSVYSLKSSTIYNSFYVIIVGY